MNRARTTKLVCSFAANRVAMFAIAWFAARRPGATVSVVEARIAGEPGLAHLFRGYFNWDGEHYLHIAERGYETPNLWAFFPLYPYLSRALGAGIGSVPIAGLVVSLVASAVGLFALERLVRASYGEEAATRAFVLALFFPTTIFFHYFYTESLFFAATALAFYFYRRDEMAFAALAAGLAALTRSSGVLLFPALAFGCCFRARRLDPRALWTLLIPAFFCVVLVNSYVQTGSLTASFDAQKFWSRSATFPLLTIAQAAQDVRLEPFGVQRELDCAATLLAFFVLSRGLRRLDAAESLFVFASLVMPLSSGLVLSMARFVGASAPLYVVAAIELRDRRHFALVLAASVALWVILAWRFTGGGELV